MITIARTAKYIDFCQNGLRFNVASNKAYSTNGSVAELVLNVNAAIVIGNIFTFTFADKTVRFTTTFTTNDSGIVFMNGSNAAQVYESLKKNYLLQKYFNISNIGSKITLTGKQVGSFYNINFWANNNNISQFSVLGGTDKTLRSGYKTLCEVYLEKDRTANTFELVATSLHNVDVNSLCDIQPGKLLSKYFADTDLPDYGQTTIKKVEKVAKRYYLKLAEMYDGSVKQVIESSVLYAVDGSINSDLYNSNFNYMDYVGGYKSYLLHPDIISFECWTDSQQFLYFIGNLTTYSLTQKVKIYYTDGTNTIVTKQTIAGAVKAETYIIPTGFAQLNLAAVNPAKEAYKYEVYLENAGALLGKAITYYLVPKPLYGREFWFKNSMGAMENVLCEKQVHKLDIKRSELLSDGNYKTDIDELNDNYECITGNKTKREIEHIAEFVSSKKTYLLQKGKYYEVAIEQGTYTLADENEDLYSYKFKYRVMATKHNLTNTPVVITHGNLAVLYSDSLITYHQI